MSIKSNMNTLKKMNAIAYPKLSPHERFKKFLRAYADNDEGLCKKLVDSCPKYTYIESDSSYTERVQASNYIVSIFLLQLLEYDKVISILKVSNLVGCKPIIADTGTKLSGIYGFLLAFDEFCNHVLGVEAQILIQAWFGFDEHYLEVYVHLKDYVKENNIMPDDKAKKHWLENVFVSTWKHRVKE